MTFYPAQIGGPNNTLFWHTTYLKNNRFQPTIITSDFGVSKDAELVHEIWIDQSYGRIIYHHERFPGFPIKVIYRTLKNLEEADVVHFNGMYNRVSLFLIFLVTLSGKPIILSPRGELFGAAIQRKSIGKSIVVFLYSLIKKKILFHATSEEEKETIKKYFGLVKIVVQPNFIAADYSEKSFDIKKDFLFLGRINPIKNIHLLIEGASKSNAFMASDARIIIAGKAWLDYEVEYQKELNKLISKLEMKDKIVFAGHVEKENKDRLIKDAYFLVLPSKSENFGNVVLEALINGTPVIASTGTPWQSLEEYGTGYWVETNTESIKDAIESAIHLSPDEYVNMSGNSIELVKSIYDVNSHENKWKEIYTKLVKS
jgi:glycosyltransferase involved in cell wall biosynthesis